MTLRDSALAYAARGWRVFPLHGFMNRACTCPNGECSSPGKHPRVRHGLHEATTDPVLITRWWRHWPNANIGIATGVVSGIVVMDVDLRHHPNELDIFRALASLVDRGIPVTLTCLTGGGGLHLYYASDDDDLSNTAGRLPGIDGELPGIDLRANGGYVVAPPSVHISGSRYEWLDSEQRIATAPDWLKRPPRRVISLDPVAPADLTGDGTAYGLAVLHEEVELVRTASVGTRNDQLNRSAFALAQLVAGGELREQGARAALAEAAAAIGLALAESHHTISSGFAAGLNCPRGAPHRNSQIGP